MILCHAKQLRGITQKGDKLHYYNSRKQLIVIALKRDQLHDYNSRK